MEPFISPNLLCDRLNIVIDAADVYRPLTLYMFPQEINPGSEIEVCIVCFEGRLVRGGKLFAGQIL